MSFPLFLKLYLISIPVFFIIDLWWLGLVAKPFYQARIGHMLEINWIAAVAFYLIFLVGLTIFAIYPASQNGGWQVALMSGALFGFFTYATYDLTNLATLKDWSLSLALVDIAWGTVLSGLVAFLTLFTSSYL